MARLWLLIRSGLMYSYYLLVKKDFQRRHLLKTSVASLGGVYVKMMQFLMLRTDLFSKDDKLEFLGLYDQVLIEPLDVMTLVRQELGQDVRQVFSQIDQTPLASGTFAQVYSARLVDGQPVVIKIKRRHIKLSLFFDFVMIKILTFLASLLFEQKMVDLPQLVREFEQTTWQELDYQREVENALLLYEFYKDHPVVVVPKTYAQFSTNNIIVQEYVEGVATTDLLRDTLKFGRRDAWLKQHYQTDLTFINKQISYSLLEQSFLLDRFYSDPHPGNIKILANNKFAFIDFGIMALSPPNRKSYHTILQMLAQPLDESTSQKLSRSFFEFTAGKLLRALEICDSYKLSASAIAPQVIGTYQALISDNRNISQRLKHTQKGDYATIWQELLHLGEQFKMKFPPGIFAALRSAFLIKSFTSLLQPDVFVMREVYQEVTANIDQDRLTDEYQQELGKADPESAVEEVADWLTNLVEYDLLLYQRLVYN